MKTGLLVWASQFALWFRLSWPFAKTAWTVLQDGEITLDELKQAIDAHWPHRMPNGAPVPLYLPWAGKLKDQSEDQA